MTTFVAQYLPLPQTLPLLHPSPPPMPRPQVLPPCRHPRPQREPAIGSDKSAKWAQPPLVGQPCPPYQCLVAVLTLTWSSPDR